MDGELIPCDEGYGEIYADFMLVGRTASKARTRALRRRMLPRWQRPVHNHLRRWVDTFWRDEGRGRGDGWIGGPAMKE